MPQRVVIPEPHATLIAERWRTLRDRRATVAALVKERNQAITDALHDGGCGPIPLSQLTGLHSNSCSTLLARLRREAGLPPASDKLRRDALPLHAERIALTHARLERARQDAADALTALRSTVADAHTISIGALARQVGVSHRAAVGLLKAV